MEAQTFFSVKAEKFPKGFHLLKKTLPGILSKSWVWTSKTQQIDSGLDSHAPCPQSGPHAEADARESAKGRVQQEQRGQAPLLDRV